MMMLAASLTERLVVAGVCVVVGALLIVAGRKNMRTKTAEETGRRRVINSANNRSNTYTGSTAVKMGAMRIVMGVLAILFGIFFAIFGPVLAK